jgi:AAA+ ATPase superfamily predicted ATPase
MAAIFIVKNNTYFKVSYLEVSKMNNYEDFKGRENYLMRLKNIFDSERFSLAVVYGRRRIGKSALIIEALNQRKEKKIYYECTRTTNKTNTELLAQEIQNIFDLPPLFFKDFYQALEFLFREGEKENIILVLDEYPYLREAIVGIDSSLQRLIDIYQNKSRMKIIICGSYIDVMKSLNESSNPLYGRIDLTLDVTSMDYYEASLFYPSRPLEEKVALYAVFVGVPYYNSKIDDKVDAETNIINLICSPTARFINEITMLLPSELKKINNANEIFLAIAKGNRKFSDILNASSVSSSPALSKTLDKLLEMELIQKVSPINNETDKKKTNYYIRDSLLEFYYTFIFPNLSSFVLNPPKVFFSEYVKDKFYQQFVPKVFERVCRQYLIRQNQKGLIIPPLMKIGKYYYDLPKERKNGEFDVVTQDKNGFTFYECKFTEKPVDDSVVNEEKKQPAYAGLRNIRFGFFSKNGFQLKDYQGLKLISLDQLYQ